MGLETVLGLSIFSSLASTAMNIGNAQSLNSQNFEQQKKLMQYQDELNSNRWNEQFNTIANYNTPKNQIGRLQEAGVNPLFDSQFGGQTSASIGANTSLPSYTPTMPQIELSQLVNTLAQSFFNEKNLKLEERKVKATEEKTGADIRNNTAQTNSEVAVNSQTVLNMIEDNNKTKAQIDEIKQNIASMKASVDQNWLNLRQQGEKLAQGWADLGIKKYTSDWQKELGNLNARISSYDAGTRRMQYGLSEQSFQFEKEKFNKNYDLEVAKFSTELKKGNIDTFLKVADLSGAQLFGMKYTSPKDIQNAMAVCASFVNTMSSMSDAEFCKVAPHVTKLMEGLSRINYTDLYKSHDKPRYSDYAPKNAQDGF